MIKYDNDDDDGYLHLYETFGRYVHFHAVCFRRFI